MSPRRNNRAESQDAPFDRYADIFENPVTAEEIEVGNRVLHSQFMENYQASTGRWAVKGRAEKAQRGGSQS
jgi:hypothetical protein